MPRFGAQGNGSRVYFGNQDSIAAQPPVLDSIAPTTPQELETVTLTGSGFGASQGASFIDYGGFRLTVTGWSDTSITATWPVISTEGSTLGFSVAADLVIWRDGATPSNALSVQTLPQSTYQYLVIATNDTGAAGIFDNDTDVEFGVDSVYGVESPADGQWDFTDLAKGIINNVPNNGTFTYSIWDVSLGEWSNQSVEGFNVAAQAVPQNVSHSHSISEPTTAVLKAATPEDLPHSHTLETTAGLLRKGAFPADLTHSHSVQTPAADIPLQQGVDSLSHSQALDTAAAQRIAARTPQDVSHSHGLDTVGASLGQAGEPQDVAHLQALSTALATKRIAIEPVDHPHTIEAPAANKKTIVQLQDVRHAHQLRTVARSKTADTNQFPPKAESMQRQVMWHLGEAIILDTGEQINAIFENDYLDPNLGPMGFEGAATYVEILQEDAGRMARSTTLTRRRDGRTYRIKEVREEEFDFIRYILEAA